MTTSAQRLRQKLLDLAIRGKLVPQNPKDEPAEKLLARIREERFNTEAQSHRGRGRSPSAPHGRATSMKSPPPITADEKPFAIPLTWTWCRLEEIASQISKGTTPHGGNDSYVPQGITFLRAENVGNDGYLHLKSLKHITADVHEHELSRSVLAAGDLLITIAGSLGHAAIVDAGILPANTNQAVSFVRLADLNSISVKYILLAIQSPVIQEMMLSKKKVTGVPNLTLEIISKLPIPLPPLAEQKRIVAALDEMLKAADAVATGMEKIAALKDRARAKILDLAIRGKLVKQDAADEPAERLLSRMRRGEMPAALTQRTQSSQRGAKASDGIESGEAASEKLCDSLRPLRSLCQLPQGKDESCLRQLTQRAQSSQRNTKSFAPIADDEKPFDIPQGWAWCRLGELGTITGGHTPSMANPKFWDGDVLWVSSKDMKSKSFPTRGRRSRVLARQN